MAIFTRARTATSSGTLAIIVLVLAFGNQAYTEWAARHAQGDNTWDLFLRTLAWPAWAFSGKDVLAHDLRALLLIIFVAAIIGVAANGVTAGAGAFFLGWFAVILGAALAAMLTAFLTRDASLYSAILAAANAAAYGLIVGWIVGIATSAGRKAAG
ncbi:hypothetical protein [Luedemannella helvata]|uniref:Uncharacterized protein n=1 Tax=Luedemannella helvata TaxID=349315 RepID=A0ABN2KEG5_9ACTN